jgi:hypothetical protein
MNALSQNRKVLGLRGGNTCLKEHGITLRNRYVVGLRSYLHDESRAQSRDASRLGRQAVALDLEILEVAHLHRSAIEVRKISRSQGDHFKLAEGFSAEATAPIVALHSAAYRNTRMMNRLKQSVRERTSALSQARSNLRHHSLKSRSAEAAVKANSNHCGNLPKDSSMERNGLLRPAREVLKAREQQRSEISHELREDIDQTLIEINARRLSLLAKAGKDSDGFFDDIVKTQRLVAESLRSMRAVTGRIRIQ